MTETPKIVLLGLGHVGLPLGVVPARRFETIGLDIDTGRINEVRRGGIALARSTASGG